jgi:tripartite-type tricarboxylate transporter receptor subunit TctC
MARRKGGAIVMESQREVGSSGPSEARLRKVQPSSTGPAERLQEGFMTISKVILGSAVIAGLGLGHAAAQEWPARPVRIVAPFAAGGSADTLGRIVAERLGEALKQNFFVENRGGAGGLIGSAQVANAEPDGYTFVISGIASHVIAPAINPSAGFDPIKSFTHVAYIGGPPIVVIAHPSLGVKSLKDLVAKAKTSADARGYVSPGAGTLGNLVAEYWGRKEGIKVEHVPYKGISVHPYA